MTKNKKKLRRVERRYSVTKSAQTLVLAGILLAGGVTGAMAADPSPATATDWTGAVSIDATGGTFGKPAIVVKEHFAETDNKNIDATSITINEGASLTLQDGARLIGKHTTTSTAVTDGMTFTLNGGALTIKTGEAAAADGSHFGFSSLDAEKVVIKKGTVTLTGKTGNAWEHAAYLGGYGGFTLDDGTINMGVNSQIFGGGAVDTQLNAGTIIMNGGLATGAANDAAHIWFGDDGGTLAGTNVTVKKASYGVISTGTEVTMSAGTLTVEEGALLRVQAKEGAKGTDSATSNLISNTSDAGAFTQEGGKIEVVDAGKVLFTAKTTFTSTGGEIDLKGGGRLLTDAGTFEGGTITIDGHKGVERSGIYDADGGGDTGEHTFGKAASGSIPSTGPTVAITSGGGIEGSKINILGGTYTLEGKAATTLNPSAAADWNMGSMIVGDKQLDIKNATVTLNNYGNLTIGRDDAHGFALKIDAGAKVIMAGDTADKAATIRATANGSTGNGSVVAINNGGTLTVQEGKHGVILASNGKMSGGSSSGETAGLTVGGTGSKLIVEKDATLVVRDASLAKDKNLTAAADDGGYTPTQMGLIVKDTSLLIGNGGTVDVTGNALIEQVIANAPAAIKVDSGSTLNVTGNLTTKKGALVMNGGTANILGTASFSKMQSAGLNTSGTGKVFVGAIDLQDAADKTAGATFATSGAELTFLGLAGGNTSIFNGDKIVVNSNGTVNLGTAAKGYTTNGGTYAGKVSVTGGNLNVAAGNWKLTHADGLVQSNGTITIAGGDLTVNKFNQTSTSKTTIGGTAAGTLTVTGNAAGDYTSVGTSSDAYGVEVKAMGTLNLQANALLTSAGALNSNIANIKGGGTLKVTGFTDNKISADGLGALKTMADKGLLDIGNTTITGLTPAPEAAAMTMALWAALPTNRPRKRLLMLTIQP